MLLLKERAVKLTIVEYLKHPLSKNEILILGKKLGLRPDQFVRKNEKEYKENTLHKLEGSIEEMAEAIEKFPKIMERPILAYEKKAIICRPPEKVFDII